MFRCFSSVVYMRSMAQIHHIFAPLQFYFRPHTLSLELISCMREGLPCRNLSLMMIVEKGEKSNYSTTKRQV